MDSINIVSYNSTGLDIPKIGWINNLAETFQIDLLGVQEHFKCIKQYDQYFRKHFPGFYPHVKPAVRESAASVGRPKGGLTQLVNKKRNFKKRNHFM